MGKFGNNDAVNALCSGTTQKPSWDNSLYNNLEKENQDNFKRIPCIWTHGAQASATQG